MIAPPDAEDPIKVLEKVVGASLRSDDEPEDDEMEMVQKPEELIDDIDFHGLSLGEFVRAEKHSEDAGGEIDLESVQSVEECEYVRLPGISKTSS